MKTASNNERMTTILTEQTHKIHDACIEKDGERRGGGGRGIERVCHWKWTQKETEQKTQIEKPAVDYFED